FECEAQDVGITIKQYCTDNGVYTAKQFGQSLLEKGQTIVGDHHHNGPAENAIKNVTRQARIMMFHAALCWPDVSDRSPPLTALQ
ncbi:MAG: hypothetical protein AAF493_17350, partial [Pseudomonadota bacterium]